MWKVFDTDGQASFASVSGDFNPMHMDALEARRTQAGAPLVHGVHALLWLLDALAERQAGLPRAASLQVRFQRMIYVGDRAQGEILSVSSSELRARILAGGAQAVGISMGFGTGRERGSPPRIAGAGEALLSPPTVPCDISLDEMAGRRGRLSFATAPERVARMFPHAARHWGPRRIAALACSSCLVGMVVPGRHSLFGGLDVNVCDDGMAADELKFAVESVDERFRLVRLSVLGGGLVGSLTTSSRPPPVAQPRMAVVATKVSPAEFRDSTALVIGGSRGLGELTAKLIAAGGGRVIVTYASGAADAAAVACEIREAGGYCRTSRYDVRESPVPQLAALGDSPTHVYYFATPTIARRKAGVCDLQRLQEFNSFYVGGFLELVLACAGARPEGVKVFYPSTVYVESRPTELTEYAMAKAAGEILCADLNTHLGGVRVLVRRLPRVPTDQTSSLLPLETADALEVMLPIVREMHRA